MNLTINSGEVAPTESVQVTVSRLAAGFWRMEQLGQELVTLDLVNLDVWRTQASIRRDTANTVLQTAFSLKECQTTTQSPAELRERLEPAADLGDADIWTKKFLRWADQFGRNLFGISNVRKRTEKKSATRFPVQRP